MLKKHIASLIVKTKSCNPLEMALYAADKTKFYKSFYGSSNLDDFNTLPLLTKYDLVGVSPYDLLSEEYKNDVFLYGETSGSCGAPTPSFFTEKDFEGLISLSSLTPYMPVIKEELAKNRTAVNGLTFGYTIAGFSFGRLMQKQGALVAQLGTRSTIGTPKRTSDTIVKLKPALISATPLDFMSWMEIIRTDHPDEYQAVLDQLKFLLSTAEPCAISRQRQIENCFSLTHVNTYASVDGFISIPCPCGEKHLLEGVSHIELFNNEKKPIGQLGKGRLCFTNLIRKTTPMVRFLLDDLVSVSDSNCRYGFKKSITPHGRYELSLELNGQTWGNLDFEEIIYQYGLFMDYKVDVFSDHIDIKLEEYPLAKGNYNLKGLQDNLSNSTGTKCNIELYPIGTITDYRMVRGAKSIIKVIDNRQSSRQAMPQIL